MPTDDDEPKLKALPTIDHPRDAPAPDHQARQQMHDDLTNLLHVAQESEAVATLLVACTEMSAEIPRAQWAAGAASLVRATRQLVRDLCDLMDRIDGEFNIE